MSFLERASRRLCCVAVVVGRGGAAPAGAAPTDVEPAQSRVLLRYDAPSGCGSREQVLERLTLLLDAAPPEVSAVVRVTPSEEGFELHFSAQHGEATSRREVTVADCAAVVEAAALLLVWTLDPGAAPAEEEPDARAAESLLDEGQEPAPSPAPLTEAPARTPDAAIRLTEPPSSRTAALETRGSPKSIRGELGLTGHLVTGLTPTVAAGVAGDVSVLLGPLSVRGALSHGWVGESALAQLPGAGLDSSLWMAALRAGPWLELGPLFFVPNVGLGVNRVSARVLGISDPTPGHTFWWSVVGGGELHWRLWGDLGLRLQGGVLVNVQRPTFTVRGLPGVIHQPDRVGVEASAGLTWWWGSR